jgi:hypothetical protein
MSAIGSLPARTESQERITMSNSQELGHHNQSPNGTKPTERKLFLSGQTKLGRTYEWVSILFLIGIVVFFVLGLQVWWYLLLVPTSLIGAIGFNLLATRRALKGGEREKQEQTQFNYKVTRTRLLTLRSVGVPTDVRRALARLIDKEELPVGTFLQLVAQDVSWKRINPWTDQILMYTRVDSPPDKK